MVCLIIVNTPGPGFVMIKARFGQVDDEVGQALFGQVRDQVGQFGQGQGQELDNIGLFSQVLYMNWLLFYRSFQIYSCKRRRIFYNHCRCRLACLG